MLLQSTDSSGEGRNWFRACAVNIVYPVFSFLCIYFYSQSRDLPSGLWFVTPQLHPQRCHEPPSLHPLETSQPAPGNQPSSPKAGGGYSLVVSVLSGVAVSGRAFKAAPSDLPLPETPEQACGPLSRPALRLTLPPGTAGLCDKSQESGFSVMPGALS